MIKRTSIRYHILSNILILIAFLLSFAACQKAIKNAPSVKPEFQTKKFYIVGHRGAAGLAPENTIPAFMRAIEIGVDAIEIDVLLTADGKLVVHHDFRLKPEITRKTDGSWLEKWDRPIVKNLTLKELKLYDVGRLNPSTSYARRYPDQEPFDGQSIPTLKEVVSLLKSKGNKNTNLWIEIKTSPEKPEMTPSPQSVASAVIKLLNEEDFMCRAQILSFDWRALAHVQKIAPEVPVVYLSHIGIRLNNIKWVCTLLNRLQNVDVGRYGLQGYFFTFDGAANRQVPQRFLDTAMFLCYVNGLQELTINIKNSPQIASGQHTKCFKKEHLLFAQHIVRG